MNYAKFCALLRDVGLAFSVSEDGGPALLVSLRKAGACRAASAPGVGDASVAPSNSDAVCMQVGFQLVSSRGARLSSQNRSSFKSPH